MATIKTLVERVEKRLFLVSGLDVQIHAEDQIVEMLRSAYNTFFDEFWYPEYTMYLSSNVNGTTGEIVLNISNMVLRYKDIHSVYWDEDEDPLPRISPGTSLGRVRTRCIGPSGNPDSVFRLYPMDETGPVHFWYRTRIADSVWDNHLYDTEINMDDELLLAAAVYEFLVMDDSNQMATQEHFRKRETRLKSLRDAQWQIPLSKRPLERDGPLTRWE